MKEQIIAELKKIEREGMADLIKYLEEGSDFFKAPCSTKFHLDVEGGLAEHSWNVFSLLKEKVQRYKLDVKGDTIALCGLMHDLCKVGFYKKDFVWRKNEETNNKWAQIETWVVDDQFPIGHGEKSVIMLQKYIKLTMEEAIAIRWHMVAFDAGIHFSYPSGFPFSAATQKFPLVTLLFTSDFEASNIIERKEEEPKKPSDSGK